MSKRHRHSNGPMVNLNDLMETLRRNGFVQNNGALPPNQQPIPMQGMGNGGGNSMNPQGGLGALAGLLGGANGNVPPMPPMSGQMPPMNGTGGPSGGMPMMPMMPMGMSPGGPPKPPQQQIPQPKANDREMLKKLLTEIITILKEDEKK
ncbi:MAG: hypothetical protein U0M15_00495 [Bacillota bacterium]|nr:hypothetical protein [Bacillota bacterium]